MMWKIVMNSRASWWERPSVITMKDESRTEVQRCSQSGGDERQFPKEAVPVMSPEVNTMEPMKKQQQVWCREPVFILNHAMLRLGKSVRG